MKLIDLRPTFLKIESDKVYRMVDEMSGADGIEFLCPVCFTKNNGEIGTHVVICWNPTVPVTLSSAWTLEDSRKRIRRLDIDRRAYKFG